MLPIRTIRASSRALTKIFSRHFLHAMKPASATTPSVKYKRIVLKLSGEVLRGGKGTASPSTPTSSSASASQVKEIHDLGVQVCVVIGGGNIFRGLAGRQARRRPHHRRLHGHARHRHQRPRPHGLPRKNGRQHPRAVRHPDEPDRRAVHPPPRHAPPREEAASSSSSPARATPISRPTPPPPSAPPSSTPTSS